MTTLRRDRAAIEKLIAQPDVLHLWVRLRDRFVDHGLVGVVLAAKKATALEIDTLLMSCRVIGRGLEELMFEQLVTAAKQMACDTVRGVYIPTDRNGSVADLYARLGFTEETAPGESEGATAWSFEVAVGYHPDAPIELDQIHAAQ